MKKYMVEWPLAIIIYLNIIAICNCRSAFNNNTQKYQLCDDSFDVGRTNIQVDQQTQEVTEYDGRSQFTNSDDNNMYQLTYTMRARKPYIISFKCKNLDLQKQSQPIALPDSDQIPIILGLYRNVLVTKQTKNSVTRYNAYVYRPQNAHIIMPIELLNPVSYASIERFTIISVDEANPSTVTALVQGVLRSTLHQDSKGYFNFFTYTLTPQPTLTQLRKTLWTSLSPRPQDSTQIIGNSDFFYDRTNERVVLYTSNQYIFFPLSIFGRATDSVRSFSLDNKVSIILFIAQNGIKGSIAVNQDDDSFTNPVNLPISLSVPYKYFTDNINNFLVVSNKKLVWVSAQKTAIVSSLDLTAQDRDIYLTDYVAVSFDKAFALYGNKIVVYRHLGQNQITLYTTIALNNNIVSPLTEIQIQYKLSCLCIIKTRVQSIKCPTGQGQCIIINTETKNCTQAVVI